MTNDITNSVLGVLAFVDPCDWLVVRALMDNAQVYYAS